MTVWLAYFNINLKYASVNSYTDPLKIERLENIFLR